MPGLAIRAIAHWALKTNGIECLLAFYRDQLGFPGMLRLTRDDGSRIAFMRMQATRRSS